MKFLTYASILFLFACATSNNAGGGFYTWVDAYGQVHTEKREGEKKGGDLDSGNSSNQVKGVLHENSLPKVNTTDSVAGEAFNPAEFTSSEIIDDQLIPKRLYNWQDQGALISQEVAAEGEQEEQVIDFIEVDEATAVSSYEYLASSNIALWDEVKGLELKLSRVYLYSDRLKQDYLLIELPSTFNAKAMIFKSYIKNSRLALPNLLFLTERFELLSNLSLPFSHHVSESWSSHGFMQGVVEPPIKAQYVLMLSNPNPGVLELGDKKVKLIDLGSIMIDSLEE
ncbi:MAG: hypothetical protein V7785_05480 [Bermanella sp.]